VFIAKLVKVLGKAANAAERRQASRRVSVMVHDVLLNQRQEQLTFCAFQSALLNEDVVEQLRLVLAPSPRSGSQLLTGDEIDLKSKDTQQEIAVDVRA
jgi:hypothetical protein